MRSVLRSVLVSLVITVAPLCWADSLAPDVWGYRGSLSGGQFFPLTPQFSSLSWVSLGAHPFVITLPPSFTQGTIIWSLTVGGHTYIQSITSSVVTGFNMFLAPATVGCPSVTASNGTFTMCGSTLFLLPEFSDRTPAHLGVVFNVPGGGTVASISRDFYVATVPEPGTLGLLGLGLLTVARKFKRRAVQ